MDIKDINPWWISSEIQKEYLNLNKRDIFNELLPYINDRQIIAITGLRRTGKTVTLHHLISYLLKQVPKENILYYTFDLLNDKIENILGEYKKQLNIDIKNSKIFVFLDEIQKHKDWEDELKVLYDNFPNMKFFISGSASMFIVKKTKENLGGRVYTFMLNPLSFKEYLKFKKIEYCEKRLSLYKDILRENLEHYLITGGFPELLETKSSTKINQYVKELVLDKVVFMDIPQVFKIDEPELLIRILSIISSNPGMIFDYEAVADDLNRNRKTISNYIFYLEKAFLIKKIYNYSKNMLTTEKKLKKIYPNTTALSYLFNAEKGKIAENSVLLSMDIKFFSRKNEKEVDFILIDKSNIIPIESKHSNNIQVKEIKGLLHFMEKNNVNEGVVITDDYENKEIIKGKKIKFIPLWKWLLG